MSDLIRRRCVVLLTVVAGAFASGPGLSQEATKYSDWRWTSSSINPEVRGEVMRHKYTQQERQNIQSAMEQLSGFGTTADRARWFSKQAGKEVVPVGKTGFYKLHEAYQRPRPDGTLDRGWDSASFFNMQGTIEDIFARGNRVVLAFRIEGNINGPFFGFEGVYQPMNIKEQMLLNYDDEAKVIW